MTLPLRQLLIPLYIFACLLLGGSSLPSLSNMALQVGAVIVLGWAAFARPIFNAGRPGSQLAAMLFGLFALFGLQLIPLPSDAWTVLPARHAMVDGFNLLEMPISWLPASLSPYATLTSALWLLPPMAVLAGVLRLDASREEWMALSLLLVAVAGVILGALQFAHYGAVASRWYLYEITDEGAAVGFFANSNHMAILLVSTVPFVVALYQIKGRRESCRGIPASAGKVAILGGSMAALLTGIALTGSRAGYALGLFAFFTSAFVRSSGNVGRARWGILAVGLGALLATAAVVSSPAGNKVASGGVVTGLSSRPSLVANSGHAVADHFPIGSGIVTFSDVYPAYENASRVDRRSVKHVHNDYVEVALKTGLLGMILMGAFFIWWAQRSLAIWRAPKVDQFARAASIASASIMLGSLADFPLRTTAISVVFASCIAIMVGVRRRPKIEAANGESVSGARHLSVDAV